MSRFPPDVLEAIRAARTVRIETQGATGPRRGVPIWVVVDTEDRVLVRSVRGERGRWYRDLLARPTARLAVVGTRLDVRAELASDADRIEACSRELRAKYPRAGASLSAMLVPDVLHTTLELHPA